MADFWRDRTVLVTGATGLLGAWLTRALVERQASVVALIRDFVPSAHFFSGPGASCVQVRGDITDGALIERVLAEYEIDTVFHLAAQSIVEHAFRDPTNTFRSNMMGTWEVLDACRRSGRPERIVVASSDKAYGALTGAAYREEDPLAGTHPYDVSKSCADLIALAYATTYALPVAVTRCGNIFGGGDLNFNRLVPGTIRSALEGVSPVIRSDGTPVRDFLYVEDAVDATLLLAARIDESAGEAWNLSLETQLDAEQMARRVLDIMGCADLELDVRNDTAQELPEQRLSAAKARSRLDWTPRVGLDEGLERTIAWYREHLGSARG